MLVKDGTLQELRIMGTTKLRIAISVIEMNFLIFCLVSLVEALSAARGGFLKGMLWNRFLLKKITLKQIVAIFDLGL